MEKIVAHSGIINFTALSILFGLVLVMIIVNSFVLVSSKDRILRYYNFYLLSSLLFVCWNFYKVLSHASFEVIQASSLADEFVSAVAGFGYLYFFGMVFELKKAKKLFKYAWLISIYTMYVQFIYLPIAWVTNISETNSETARTIFFLILTLCSLFVLFYGIFFKNKTGFQKIIIAGSILFYIMIIIVNLQEQQSRTGGNIGLNALVFSLIMEHLFFAVASSSRIKSIYSNAQQLKLKSIRDELQVASLNKEMVTWQLSALHSQMNPHFIFNALNSIQQFTLKNETDNANNYISKFSKLLRNVLQTSQQPFVTLEAETEQLNLYLDIEQLRMGAAFSFEIKIADDIETDALKIPSMLIQPLVENALVHGLLHKEGIKKLEIDCALTDDQVLKVAVKDNGIGRAKAQLLKEQQQKFLPHTSSAISIVKQRLASLGDGSLVFNDLFNEHNEPAGTEAIICIPLI